MAKELDSGNVLCEQCGNEYEMIAQHWSNGSICEYPDIHPYLKEIITGLMMGDGSLNRGNKNPYIDVSMISYNYLQYLNDIFGWMSGGVFIKRTAEESAADCRDRGFSPNADSSNYSDIYRLKSMSHPELDTFNWYESGKKVWPDDIDLTPATLTHWYTGDGCWANRESSNHIKISMCNEADYTDKVSDMFRRAGLPCPRYGMSERGDGGVICNACWTVEESHELWECMETPPPDFHYKFPEEYRV